MLLLWIYPLFSHIIDFLLFAGLFWLMYKYSVPSPILKQNPSFSHLPLKLPDHFSAVFFSLQNSSKNLLYVFFLLFFFFFFGVHFTLTPTNCSWQGHQWPPHSKSNGRFSVLTFLDSSAFDMIDHAPFFHRASSPYVIILLLRYRSVSIAVSNHLSNLLNFEAGAQTLALFISYAYSLGWSHPVSWFKKSSKWWLLIYNKQLSFSPTLDPNILSVYSISSLAQKCHMCKEHLISSYFKLAPLPGIPILGNINSILCPAQARHVGGILYFSFFHTSHLTHKELAPFSLLPPSFTTIISYRDYWK